MTGTIELSETGGCNPTMGRILPSILFVVVHLILFQITTVAQNNNPYHLPIVSDTAVYHAQCRADSNNLLVDLASYIPGIQLDIRYATFENFTGQVIYPEAKAFARLPVANALKRAQADLNDKGVGLKIFDAYRPYSATLLLWTIMEDTLYVAAPWVGSRHNRGCAVDITVIDTVSGNELEMPTAFDDFTPAASPTYSALPQAILENRNSLIEVMSRYGFRVLDTEWWHFDFEGWEKYPLMDIPFSELEE
ncbi:MAG: M15 family metallopeptidase [Bacteroidales bacterium]|nr:M15 family metallopeptidase [Bacteroidales bacterium]